MSIHENLRRLRRSRGLTQEQVAAKIGLTRQAISSYESGRTRPDVDMLLRLAQLYETDLDGLLYGRDREQKALRRVKTGGMVLLVCLALLTALSSGLRWIANRFYAMPEGVFDKSLFASRQKWITVWEMTDELLLAVALLGLMLLLGLRFAGKCRIPAKQKLLYAAALAAVPLAMGTLFGMTDPVFSLADYWITPCLVAGGIVFFLALDILLQFLQTKISEHKSEESRRDRGK